MGRFSTTIVGTTQIGEIREFHIPVRAEIANPIPDATSRIFAPALLPGQTVEISLIRPGGDRFEISEFSYEGPDFLDVKLIQDGDGFPLAQVTRKSSPTASRLAIGSVTIRAAADGSRVTIPLRVVLGDPAFSNH